MCKKVVYYTRNKAWKMAKKESLRLCKSMYFYRCPLCGWWHLTHTSPRDFKRKKRYMVQGRLTNEREALRERWEECQYGLGQCLSMMDEQTMLRVSQAIRRDPSLDDLLGPAVDQLQFIYVRVCDAKVLLGDVWYEQSEKRWSMADGD